MDVVELSSSSEEEEASVSRAAGEVASSRRGDALAQQLSMGPRAGHTPHVPNASHAPHGRHVSFDETQHLPHPLLSSGPPGFDNYNMAAATPGITLPLVGSSVKQEPTTAQSNRSPQFQNPQFRDPRDQNPRTHHSSDAQDTKRVKREQGFSPATPPAASIPDLNGHATQEAEKQTAPGENFSASKPKPFHPSSTPSTPGHKMSFSSPLGQLCIGHPFRGQPKLTGDESEQPRGAHRRQPGSMSDSALPEPAVGIPVAAHVIWTAGIPHVVSALPGLAAGSSSQPSAGSPSPMPRQTHPQPQAAASAGPHDPQPGQHGSSPRQRKPPSSTWRASSTSKGAKVSWAQTEQDEGGMRGEGSGGRGGVKLEAGGDGGDEVPAAAAAATGAAAAAAAARDAEVLHREEGVTGALGRGGVVSAAGRGAVGREAMECAKERREREGNDEGRRESSRGLQFFATGRRTDAAVEAADGRGRLSGHGNGINIELAPSNSSNPSENVPLAPAMKSREQSPAAVAVCGRPASNAPHAARQPDTQQLDETRSRLRRFWHAGDYHVDISQHKTHAGMDRARVHPKFLHTNATSHKWALGAIAELLDNALDEVPKGATFVSVDVERSPRDAQPMLVVQDDGGGMTPEALRRCMSFGFSQKTKDSKTIGQYGNGFKTSTMRLGADVIVFTRCQMAEGYSESIGLLSFSFLRDKGMDHVVVPTLDFHRASLLSPPHPNLMSRSQGEWNSNLATMLTWTPFASEESLQQQLALLPSPHGTRLLIFNLWLADDGLLELDFDTDPQDIQLAGQRKEGTTALAFQFPRTARMMTYQYSLRAYASILYLHLPSNFRIILRGVEVETRSILADLIHAKEFIYRSRTDLRAYTNLLLGFHLDAAHHIDIEGFCFYHKNRLIKPFWRLWKNFGTSGRGMIGVLEVDFIEPAHDKQGFEHTKTLELLNQWLLDKGKGFWAEHCAKIGYHRTGLKRQASNPKTPSAHGRSLIPAVSVSHSSQMPAAAASPLSLLPWVGSNPGNGGHSLPREPKQESREVPKNLEDADDGHDDDLLVLEPLPSLFGMGEEEAAPTAGLKPGTEAFQQEGRPDLLRASVGGRADATQRPNSSSGIAAFDSSLAAETGGTRGISLQVQQEEGTTAAAREAVDGEAAEVAEVAERGLSMPVPNSQEGEELMRVVKSDWLARLQLELSELRARNWELEAALAAHGEVEGKLKSLQELVFFTSEVAKVAASQRQREAEQWKVAERDLEEKIKDARLQAEMLSIGRDLVEKALQGQ